MEQLKEFIKKAFEEVVSGSPFMVNTIRGLILVGIVLLIWFFTQRVRKGDELKLLFFIELKSNAVVEAQKKIIENLLEDGKQKIQVIKLLDRFSVELSQILSLDSYEEFLTYKKATYEYLLYGIGSILTKSKSNSHRVAIFVPEDEKNLKMKEGVGFSAEGKQKLRLAIQNSSAGYVFRTGEIYNSGDIHSSGNVFRLNAEAKKVYNSLACLPIYCGKNVIGVLSIDGEEKESFNKDDLDYLTYFANILAPLIFFDHNATKVVQTKEAESNDTAI